MINEWIQEGFGVFVSDAGKSFGAVRHAPPHGKRELVVYVENAGDFTIGLDTVKAVHAQKIIGQSLSRRSTRTKILHRVSRLGQSTDPRALGSA